MAFLELAGVSKAFDSGGRRACVLREINLAIERQEFVAVVGFSGAGKTTLVNLIAGLIAPDTGRVRLNGLEVTGPGPDRGVVFQNYSLLPWLTVRQNVALAVDRRLSNASPERRRQEVRRHLETVGLLPAADKYPRQLSGGMRQRVSLARALAMDPQVLLLDEPLSALDALTRATLQDEFARLSQVAGKTMLLITNDVDEALLLADRIIPMSPGPEATLGPPIPVPIPRPRDRTSLNHDATFKHLRAQVTTWLLDAAAAKREPRPSARAGLAGPVPSSPGALPPKPILDISYVTKSYPAPKGTATIVQDFHLGVLEGEFVSIIGHSGCGKSTVLSMVAGLVEPTSGAMILSGREISGPGIERGVVFQAPCLLPWLTALENVQLAVDQAHRAASRAQRRRMAEHYLTLVGLEGALSRRPAELSQGMRQRVGLARAFALDPKLLLLDEPFGMLDSLTRIELQDALLELWGRDRKTALMVTHDVDEALFLSDRIVMMTRGPAARVGQIVAVPFPRPRDRKALLEEPEYYRLRERLVDFLHHETPHPDSHRPNRPRPDREGSNRAALGSNADPGARRGKVLAG